MASAQLDIFCANDPFYYLILLFSIKISNPLCSLAYSFLFIFLFIFLVILVTRFVNVLLLFPNVKMRERNDNMAMELNTLCHGR